MIVRRYFGYLAFFLFHFALIGTVSVHETLRLLKTHVVSIPIVSASAWEVLDTIPAAVAADTSLLNLEQKAIATYTNLAGIEAGYGYFAPNIPSSSALVLEFHYPDGRVEYGIPQVASHEAEIRLSTLLEQIANAELPEWREELIKLLADSSRRLNRGATSVRAFFGTIAPPTVEQYKAGKRERIFSCQYVYDFDYPKDGRSGRGGTTQNDRPALSR